MLKKIILCATMVALLVSSTACGNKIVEQREYCTTAIFHEDLKNPGTGVFFTEDAHYTVDSIGSEYGELADGCWYVVEFNNNGTTDKTDDVVISWTAL